MAPTGSSHLNGALAVLCAGGGIFGYTKAKSVPSLVAGLALGAAYGYAAYTINAPDGDPATGHLAGFGTSVALAGAMGARFLRTGKVMPAGLLMAGGVAGSLYNWGKYQEWTGA